MGIGVPNLAPGSRKHSNVITRTDWCASTVDELKDMAVDCHLIGDAQGETDGIYPSGLVVKLDLAARTCTPLDGAIGATDVLAVIDVTFSDLLPGQKSSQFVPVVYRNVALIKSKLTLRTTAKIDDVVAHFESKQNCAINTVA